MKKLLIKSITWRILALLSSYVVALLFGLSAKQALAITVILNIINHGLYITHDYIWIQIDRIRIRKAFKDECIVKEVYKSKSEDFYGTYPNWYKPECECKDCDWQ